jgi:ubiquinone/menaquinone biosynthesis C-methylase UbiE
MIHESMFSPAARMKTVLRYPTDVVILSVMGHSLNPFDDPALAARYEDWYADRGRRADILERSLLSSLLSKFPDASTVLEVGCGTGHFARWFAEKGYRVVGLDISPAMLSEARKRNGVSCLLAAAEKLPFADRSFDLVGLITTLEFVVDPQRALSEALRVAGQGMILGVLNRHSLLGIRRLRSAKPPWDAAKLYTPRELVCLVEEAAGERPVSLQWRTTLWPLPLVSSLPLPWGGFIGMAARIDNS